MPTEQRREQLLDTALRLINESGIAAVSVDSVARSAGVTRPVVYGIFDDAAHLLRELLDREASAALREFEASLPPVPERGDPAQVAAEAFSAVMAAITRNPQRWRALLLPIEDVGPPHVRHRLQEGHRIVREQFTAFSTWAVEHRGLNLDPELLARAMFSWIVESGRMILSDPDSYPPERLITFSQQLGDLFFSNPQDQ